MLWGGRFTGKLHSTLLLTLPFPHFAHYIPDQFTPH